MIYTDAQLTAACEAAKKFLADAQERGETVDIGEAMIHAALEAAAHAAPPAAQDAEPTRKQGHSKLVYDKERRTIVSVDPHPAPPAAQESGDTHVRAILQLVRDYEDAPDASDVDAQAVLQGAREAASALAALKAEREAAQAAPLRRAWPDPTPEMLNGDPLFDAIWDTIKTWDVNVPDVYSGYCGANGNHVRAIYDAVKVTYKS
jgi:hypothetical protein